MSFEPKLHALVIEAVANLSAEVMDLLNVLYADEIDTHSGHC